MHKQGFFPGYFGCLEDISIESLIAYVDPDMEGCVNAIFLEYIPGLVRVSLDNFTVEGLHDLARGLQAVHAAGDLQNDINARNMMVTSRNTSRTKIMWLDFDTADTYDLDFSTAGQQQKFDDEQHDMPDLQECLVSALF